MLGPHLGVPTRTLDVGSADGPSVGWMRLGQQHVMLDLFPDGLVPGEGVCGSATALPFADASFDVVAAFDVVEHCLDDVLALRELQRVLMPRGRLLLSVPAYQWAWSDHDERAGHHRRYTRARLVALVEGAGLTVERSTYAFCAVFPFFLSERLLRRVRRQGAASQTTSRLTPVPPVLDRLLMRLSRAERRVLSRQDAPFGSSVFLAARKPG